MRAHDAAATLLSPRPQERILAHEVVPFGLETQDLEPSEAETNRCAAVPFLSALFSGFPLSASLSTAATSSHSTLQRRKRLSGLSLTL